MLNQLSPDDRLKLMKFVCSFAWADFEVRPEERAFISRLIHGLELDREEELAVHRWLDVPPSIEEIDPTTVPHAHRRLFLDAVEGVIHADGQLSDEEAESFELFRQLVV